jgi:hypothetical protein
MSDTFERVQRPVTIPRGIVTGSKSDDADVWSAILETATTNAAIRLQLNGAPIARFRNRYAARIRNQRLQLKLHVCRSGTTHLLVWVDPKNVAKPVSRQLIDPEERDSVPEPLTHEDM